MWRCVGVFVAWAALLFAGCSATSSQQKGDSTNPQHAKLATGHVQAVRALIFYAPNCGHCHHIITQVLPPLVDGRSVQVKTVNVWSPEGQSLYQSLIKHFDLKPERQGVPTMVVGKTILVGSQEIPDQFPKLIQQHAAAGGLAWPEFPGLEIAYLNQLPGLGNVHQLTVWEKVSLDPVGNGLSIVVLAAMLFSLLYIILSLWQATVSKSRQHLAQTVPVQLGWAIALLSLVGLSVALYLAYIEASHKSVVCGPVGDCAAVQQSEYARLFGIPVAYLGVLAYGSILFAWICSRVGEGRSLFARGGAWIVWATSFGGVLFSIYLTFLEPFVIGATCAWCLTSAIVVTSICLLTAREFKRANFYQA